MSERHLGEAERRAINDHIQSSEIAAKALSVGQGAGFEAGVCAAYSAFASAGIGPRPTPFHLTPLRSTLTDAEIDGILL